MPKGVTLQQIEEIFVILDRLNISREAVIIPLRPAESGGARRLANGKFEIVVDAVRPFDEWVAELEAQLQALLDA